MSEYLIEHGIPLPLQRRPLGTNSKYPFRQMNVGDSFFIAAKKATEISGCLKHYRQFGLRFAVRTITENGISGVRVWRIE